MEELGGEIAGKDTFLQSDTSLASQITRFRNADTPDVVFLGSFPGGTRRSSRRSAAPTTARSCSRPRSRGRSGSSRRPISRTSGCRRSARATATTRGTRSTSSSAKFEEHTGKPAAVDTYPLLGYSLVQTIAKGVEQAGTTDGEELAKALETFEDEPLLAGPTTYTERVPRPGRAGRC